MSKSKSTKGDTLPLSSNGAPTDGQKSASRVTKVKEGYLIDFLTEKPKKETGKELVRQRVARAIAHEYDIRPSDMEPDFPVRVEVNGRTSKKRVDIAIFEQGTDHTPENVRRVVVCKAEPKNGRKGVAKLRDHQQARNDLELVKAFMAALPNCKYGMWTNNLDFFYLRKEQHRFETRFVPLGYWPSSDESFDTKDVVSEARLRDADAERLKTAFRRCHNFIHGNEGMPKDAAFWQFLYLIFAKMYDERHSEEPQFWAGPMDMFEPDGQERIRKRIIPLFDRVKEEYPKIFRGNEEITLSDRALAFMVSELAKYDFTRSSVDAKGAAYQELVGTNLRGDRGQYFTPRVVIDLAVEILDPKPNERVLDPACGTGGFLVATLKHMLETFRAERQQTPEDESTDEFLNVQARLREYAQSKLFGADFDPFLVRASTMNITMASGADGHIFHMDSLAFPGGHLQGVEAAKKYIKLGKIDVLMTNPPFGSDIPITDPDVLYDYDLSQRWEKAEEGGWRSTGKYVSSIAPEVLFIQQCVRWLRPGGRMAIVLPNGILGNPGDEYIRQWILRNCWVLASVEIPIEAFIVEANVNILTSLLFLKKKTDDEIRAEDLQGPKEYPVFMAVAEKAGVDRRGNKLYKRSPDGEELVEEVIEIETFRNKDGTVEKKPYHRKKKIEDNDFPDIAEAYREFRRTHREPGA